MSSFLEHRDGLREVEDVCVLSSTVFFFQAEDGIRDLTVTGVQTCALPISFTTDPTVASLFRLPIEPSQANGLRAVCRLMVDKITTVPKTKIGARVGRVTEDRKSVV